MKNLKLWLAACALLALAACAEKDSTTPTGETLDEPAATQNEVADEEAAQNEAAEDITAPVATEELVDNDTENIADLVETEPLTETEALEESKTPAKAKALIEAEADPSQDVDGRNLRAVTAMMDELEILDRPTQDQLTRAQKHLDTFELTWPNQEAVIQQLADRMQVLKQQFRRRVEHSLLEGLLGRSLTPTQFDIHIKLQDLVEKQTKNLHKLYSDEIGEKKQKPRQRLAPIDRPGGGHFHSPADQLHDNAVGGILGGPVLAPQNMSAAQITAKASLAAGVQNMGAARGLSQHRHERSHLVEASLEPGVYPIGVRGKHIHQVQ